MNLLVRTPSIWRLSNKTIEILLVKKPFCPVGEICDKTAYDPARQVCCCGVVWKKKTGYQCCGKNYHNMAAEKCCDSQRAIVVPIKGNCP